MTPEGKPIRVASVDDHDLMRNGIRFVLMAFDDLLWVGEARKGEDAVKLCKDIKPDVVLVDMKMKGLDGVQTASAIKQACADIQVLILTSFHDQQLVLRAMQVGAVGYVLKDASKEELANAIRAASVGQTTISADAVNDLLSDSPEARIELTNREREVLALVVKGMSNKEIAKHLHRSPFTIRHHVSQLIKRLGAANRAEVAAIAIQRHLIR
ncbi:Transcriptional regulatory protein LiaR [Planctomycetes bacterium CA13]|uniref:Transcriptional regulatory protein LiaR n=1 Tax=Novipirellula herctigrandis TaxID=2527986 RepID=A0A5C5Z263_9BACT|nr:Transcriptional regulatory protein LiaR [Planctomycetes bacterium CA13]